MLINREELAWAAGFFDGEGFSGARTSKGRTTAMLSVHQVDRRALDRFQSAVFGIGRIHGPYGSKTEKRNPIYHYRLNRYEEVQAVVAALWHWLGPVKRAQAASALRCASAGLMVPRKDALAAHCHKGHEYALVGTYVNPRRGLRWCRQCKKDSENKRYLIRKGLNAA